MSETELFQTIRSEKYRDAKKRLNRMLRFFEKLRPSGMPVTYRHNRVVLLPNGEKFFNTLFAAIRASKYSILAEFYIIRADSIGEIFAEELMKAAARGVKVYLIYDYIGSIETPSFYFRRLASAGVKLLAFNPISFSRGISWFDRRDHRKMTIVDEKLALLGGFNIGDAYSGKLPAESSFRDAGFSVIGSAVSELVSLFKEFYNAGSKKEIELPTTDENEAKRYHGYASISFIKGNPLRVGFGIKNAFLFNIASASEELLIANPYFVPGPRVIRALLRAAKRGVKIKLLMPSKSDVPIVQIVGRSFYSLLLQGGIEIYEMINEMLHAKVMLIDGERSFIGSANLDQRSFHRNFEINGIVDSAAFGRQIRKMLDGDFSKAKIVSLDEHESRGIFIRALEKIASAFSWFL